MKTATNHRPSYSSQSGFGTVAIVCIVVVLCVVVAVGSFAYGRISSTPQPDNTKDRALSKEMRSMTTLPLEEPSAANDATQHSSAAPINDTNGAFSLDEWDMTFVYDTQKLVGAGCLSYGNQYAWFAPSGTKLSDCGWIKVPPEARIVLYSAGIGIYSEEAERITEDPYFKSASAEDVTIAGLPAIKKTVIWAGASDLIPADTKTITYTLPVQAKEMVIKLTYWERPGETDLQAQALEIVESLKLK